MPKQNNSFYVLVAQNLLEWQTVGPDQTALKQSDLGPYYLHIHVYASLSQKLVYEILGHLL